MFWVYASNAARFEQSYRDIADCVKIVRRQDLRANIFKLVHDWLRDSKDPWLLILDKVDDARLLLHLFYKNYVRTVASKPNLYSVIFRSVTDFPSHSANVKSLLLWLLKEDLFLRYRISRFRVSFPV